MTVSWYRRELDLGATGEDVRIVQRRLGAPVTGIYDEDTMAYVRGLQRLKGLPMSGKTDNATADAVGEKARAGMLPEWYSRPLHMWDEGDDVRELRLALGFTNGDNRYDPDLELAVRRFQSEHELTPSGRIDEETALKLV